MDYRPYWVKEVYTVGSMSCEREVHFATLEELNNYLVSDRSILYNGNYEKGKNYSFLDKI